MGQTARSTTETCHTVHWTHTLKYLSIIHLVVFPESCNSGFTLSLVTAGLSWQCRRFTRVKFNFSKTPRHQACRRCIFAHLLRWMPRGVGGGAAVLPAGSRPLPAELPGELGTPRKPPSLRRLLNASLCSKTGHNISESCPPHGHRKAGSWKPALPTGQGYPAAFSCTKGSVEQACLS